MLRATGNEGIGQFESEWLETDGSGGFASGTVAGIRTRRYHGLLIAATTPPTGRMVLVNGLEVWIETREGRYALSAQHYAPDVVFPDGNERIVEFSPEPWPTWTYRLENGLMLRQEIVVAQQTGETLIRWEGLGITGPSRLLVRPLLSGRNYHALHRENAAFEFRPEHIGQCIRWRPYSGCPAIAVLSNGTYSHEPLWFRNFRYQEENRRGLDNIEDLASPGTLSFDIAKHPAILLLHSDALPTLPSTGTLAVERAEAILADETLRRKKFQSPIDRAAEQYIVRRGRGKTIIAGYPWFTDWGRDTFIALRGLCIARGRLDTACEILLAWADVLSEGMLPNRFPDDGAAPEYNSVDASLWYVVAVHDLLKESAKSARGGWKTTRDRLEAAVMAIVEGYATGTRFGIRMEPDGLLAAGRTGDQLTWMDARVGDCVITPRIGKPVEVQALWLNALWIAGHISSQWHEPFERGLRSFGQRFWDEDGGYLFDNIDVDHIAGTSDGSFRPNQILAVGGLPYAVLTGERARRVVNAVEERLLTPFGLRTLAPGEPSYKGRYSGDPQTRDAAYHQGTVWPWLVGPFIEGWLRVNGSTPEARLEALRRFLAPLQLHLRSAGLGHVSEILDGDPPHTPRGCPFQAWSLGELCRMEHLLDCQALPPSSLRHQSFA